MHVMWDLKDDYDSHVNILCLMKQVSLEMRLPYESIAPASTI